MIRRLSTTLFLVLLVLFNLSTHTFVSAKKYTSLPIDLPTDKRYAFVTLLYSDDFVLGVRTLGQSLRETQDKARLNIEHLVLVTPRVGLETRQVLLDEGWKVKEVPEHKNPNNNYAERLHGVYTKLEIFRLTEYHRVVYLDADTTLLENVDELFLCGPFCAVMRHSELINTGVIVTEPSDALHTDLSKKVGEGMYSYTGGDQGFLNSYYQDYAACPYFEPMKQIGLGSDGSKCRRLPHRYNGDWPIAMLNGQLEMVRTKNSMQEEFGEFRRSRILHYTVGAFKPWDWYAAAIFPFTYHWTTAAARLPKTSKDNRQTQKEVVSMSLGLFYVFVWVMVVLHGCRARYHGTVSRRHTSSSSCCSGKNPIKWIFSIIRQQMQPRNTTNGIPRNTCWNRDPLSKGSLFLHLLVGYACLFTGIGVGWKMVPQHTHKPIMGFSIFLVWVFGVFFSLYSLYILRWFLQGEAHRTTTSAKSADMDLEQNPLLVVSLTAISPTSPKSPRRIVAQLQPKISPSRQAAQSETLTYGGGFVLLIVWVVLVRVRAHTVSFGQVLPPLIGLGLATVLGLTVVFYRLPLMWYQEGLAA